jgi:transcription antitermination factor NusG
MMNTSITDRYTTQPNSDPNPARPTSDLGPAGPADDLEQGACPLPRWYAAYTCANHERRVADQFANRGVEHFLPTYESVRRWKDRKVRLRMPLFPSYIFVQIALCDRLRVLEVPSVVRLVGFDRRPVSLADDDLKRIRQFLERGFHAEPHPYLIAGKRVRVSHGPLAGMEGILSQRKGKFRVVISIELVQRAVAVDVAEADVDLLP